MKSLLKFLLSQKKAAHLRCCNYSTSQTKTDDDSVATNNATGVSGGGVTPNGRGGGQGQGGPGRDQQYGGAKGDDAGGVKGKGDAILREKRKVTS